MFKQILVPLDGWEYSERALGFARELARATGGALRLVTLLLRPEAPGAPRIEKLDQRNRSLAEYRRSRML